VREARRRATNAQRFCLEERLQNELSRTTANPHFPPKPDRIQEVGGADPRSAVFIVVQRGASRDQQKVNKAPPEHPNGSDTDLAQTSHS
jgi:hypothetical protein